MDINRTTSSLLRAHSRDSFSRLVFESEHSLGFGGDKNRSLLFRLCQCFVVLFRLVTPFSYVFLSLLWLHNFGPLSLRSIIFKFSLRECVFEHNDIWHQTLSLPAVTELIVDGIFKWQNILYYTFVAWMAAEALFFPYYYHLFTRMSQRNEDLTHYAPDHTIRMRLVRNCFESLKTSTKGTNKEPQIYLRKVIEGWFLDEPLINIYYGNIFSWASFAFFGKDVQDLTGEESDENKEIVNYLEEQLQWKFPEGINAHAPPARLNLDPVFATQRPFFFYASVGIVNATTHGYLRHVLGFKPLPQYDTPENSQRIYYRPAAKPRKGGKNPPPADKKALPVVFVHGIGIGFTHYVSILSRLSSAVDVYLIEWPYVAMQMVARGPTHAESVGAVTSALRSHGHQQACFVAHSLGSVLVSWMLHDEIGATFLASSVLMDPVTFLLCDPTVATMFVYKDPTNAVDFLMHFFLSRELFIANALSRHFAWSHNIMFVEDFKNHIAKDNANAAADATGDDAAEDDEDDDDDSIPNWEANIKHTIFLSSHDVIVPIGPVSRYLNEKSQEGHPNFEVMMFHGTHGEMFIYPSWVKLITRKIKERCNLLMPLSAPCNERIIPSPESCKSLASSRSGFSGGGDIFNGSNGGHSKPRSHASSRASSGDWTVGSNISGPDE